MEREMGRKENREKTERKGEKDRSSFGLEKNSKTSLVR